MQRLVHRGWLQEHAAPPITAAYVAFAILLGLLGDTGAATSPMSSASATAILASIASGMIALTAIVFSLVFVALQISGSAFTPRLARVFGSANLFAHSLGIFTGTFLYALLAIRTVDIAGGAGVDLRIVIVAIGWLLASIGVLVMLLPRVRSLSIGDVLVMLHRSAATAAMRVYDVADGTARPAEKREPAGPITAVIRHAGSPKYLLGLDVPRLVRCAAEIDGVIVVRAAIGDAIIAGDQLAVVIGGSRPISEARIRSALWLGDDRTVDNDPAYVIQLLVDVAIRALSPAVNDPTTAVSALDQIDGLLRLLATLDLENDRASDEQKVVRLIRAVPTWDDLVRLALAEIDHYGRDSFQVQRRLATLHRDLAELLPAHRSAAIERFAEAVGDARHAERWTHAPAYERHGLGHQVPSS